MITLKLGRLLRLAAVVLGLTASIMVGWWVSHAWSREHTAATPGTAYELAWASAASVLWLGLLLGIMALLHRRIVRPLEQMARNLQTMAQGAQNSIPKPQAGDEMATLFWAATSLQHACEQHAALERERDGLILRLRDQSNTDSLTSLPNRHAFFASAERELAQAQRHGFHLVTLMLDVDNFKQVNEAHGHAVGDQVLAAIASVLRRSLRDGDLVARYGGEEFIMVLPHCDEKFGLRFAERLRAAIEALAISRGADDPLRVTVSLGLSHSGTCELNLQKMIARADQAMHCAKQSGRNRVVVSMVREA